MARETMRILQAVRRRSVEEARRALGACLAAEAETADRLRALDDAASRDCQAHPELPEAHQFLDMFALRTQARASDRQEAELALAAAQAASAEARTATVTARTAAE